MNDSEVIQLTTLWFVVMIFVQTGGNADSAFLTAVGIFALLLVYVLPVVILGGLAASALRD